MNAQAIYNELVAMEMIAQYMHNMYTWSCVGGD